MEPTSDPTCNIEKRGIEDGVPYVVYSGGGERWRIRGVCKACGECEVGRVDADNLIWTGIPIGEAGACLDPDFGLTTRLDVPVRPEIAVKMKSCSLWGEYL